MNRYKIKNLRSGFEFAVIKETQPLLTQPEWGKQAGTKRKAECDEWELANGQSAGEDEQGQELWSYPDSRQLTVENIDAEITQEEQKKTQFNGAVQRLLDFDADTATAAQQRQFMKDVRRALIYLFKNQ